MLSRPKSVKIASRMNERNKVIYSSILLMAYDGEHLINPKSKEETSHAAIILFTISLQKYRVYCW